jgi:hypothetical protein
MFEKYFKKLIILSESGFIFVCRARLICWEKVTTTKIRTSKSKKNVEKFVSHHYVESVFLVHHYYDITTSKSIFLVDHNIENQNVKKNEKNVESICFVKFSKLFYLWRKYLWHFVNDGR